MDEGVMAKSLRKLNFDLGRDCRERLEVAWGMIGQEFRLSLRLNEQLIVQTCDPFEWVAGYDTRLPDGSALRVKLDEFFPDGDNNDRSLVGYRLTVTQDGEKRYFVGRVRLQILRGVSLFLLAAGVLSIGIVLLSPFSPLSPLSPLLLGGGLVFGLLGPLWGGLGFWFFHTRLRPPVVFHRAEAYLGCQAGETRESTEYVGHTTKSTNYILTHFVYSYLPPKRNKSKVQDPMTVICSNCGKAVSVGHSITLQPGPIAAGNYLFIGNNACNDEGYEHVIYVYKAGRKPD